MTSGTGSIRSLLRDVFRLPVFTMTVVLTFLVVGLTAPHLAPYDPNVQDLSLRLVPPSWEHWFGTDALGRDVLSRVIHGARVSLIVVFFALLGGAGLGMLLGLLSGYMGGTVDLVISRLVEAAMSIPALLIGILLGVALGSGIFSMVLAISLILWAHFARIIRADVMSLRSMDFITLASVIGSSPARIMLKHVVPNILGTAMVLVSINLGEVILLEAALSFLGVGVPPPTPSWGNMVASGQPYLARAWWLTVFPAGVILLTVLAFNILGDWARDHLDPRLRDRL